MTQIEAMKLALEALKNNKLTHLYCEDTWYSCPKHEDGCANEAEGDECNCGADDVNAQFDQAITALEEALAQPEQEPVAIKRMKEWIEYLKRKSDFGQHMKIPSEMSAGTCWELALELEQFINTTPPQQEPVIDKSAAIRIATSLGWTPQRKPLTDEEIDKLLGPFPRYADEWSMTDFIRFARAIEAAHGIKENT